ncbi:MAG: zinc ribbon domain-containing protein, partial [Acidimicrobiia bacterium]|nr:zinc ribbon domain-containing protein [Acidimicrobiia bacterium]
MSFASAAPRHWRPTVRSMQCRACGADVRDSDRFCNACGTSLAPDA